MVQLSNHITAVHLNKYMHSVFQSEAFDYLIIDQITVLF